MTDTGNVLEYKCPCCNAALRFGMEEQKMVCQYCDNTFEVDAVKAYNESLAHEEEPSPEWTETSQAQWSEDEQSSVRTYTCNSCGGELITEDTTAATFCPYCDSPTIIQGRLSGGIKPDLVLPFKKSKEDAKAAFLSLCKGKLLLPKGFTSENRLEKITGMYVPFWLYDCNCKFNGQYRATRNHHWSDSRYNYTRTEYYTLFRYADARFERIPMDASSKLNDVIMESIEPFDYSQVVDFNTAYLSGYLADKFDVEAVTGRDRIKQRISATMDRNIRQTTSTYLSVTPTQQNAAITHGKEKYALLPVWMLYTKYRNQTYVFAMNGQTGKMTGSFPICPIKSAMWFSGICAGVTALVTLVQYLMF